MKEAGLYLFTLNTLKRIAILVRPVVQGPQTYKGAAASAKMLVKWLSVASKSESDSTLE